MPFFQVNTTFRLDDIDALYDRVVHHQKWKLDVIREETPLGHLGSREGIVWSEAIDGVALQVGKTDFILNGPANGKVSYTVDIKTVTEVEPVETAYFDRDPSTEEGSDPEYQDRAAGWYFRYATEGEDDWSGPHESETDAIREAGILILNAISFNCVDMEQAHQAALSAAAGIVTLLGAGTDDAADHSKYMKLHSLHTELERALVTRFNSARRHILSSRLATEIDARDNRTIEPADSPGF